MWVSRKKWEALEKKVADLEKEVRSQPLEIIRTLSGLRYREMTKSSPRRQKK